MASKRPVVIYGANGFSGRLVAEFLREYNVPFIAAGRDRSRLEAIMTHVPGIETADYEIAQIDGSADALVRLFSGARVVCNTAGPFIYNGPRVVEACLLAGCQYLDISGEQAWLREAAENWGPKFAERNQLLAPATAFMSATSEIAGHMCLEAAAIDSLEFLTMFKGIPTFGSTQTIFAVIQTDAYYLEQNKYKTWPRAIAHEVVIPGMMQTQLALPWGGFPHSVWFKDHPQVANVRSLGGILDRQLMQNVLATEKHFEESIRPLPKEDQERKLREMANSVQAGTPPRENTHEHRTIDVVYGRGTMDAAQCTIFGTCAYRQTGLLQAYAARSLARTAPKCVGFASPCAAFGHRELLKALESHGLAKARMN
jgi:short subunit dehydrogenase-like uncharacterized protein